MKKLFVKISIVLAGITGVASAQQDPQFTQFMFNKLIYNPGYAGTSGAICGVAQYRKQWVGFEGPTSVAFAGDMRAPGNLPIGVGINIITDKIGVYEWNGTTKGKSLGALSTTMVRAAGAYNLKLAGGTLGIGIDIGMLQKRLDADWITPEPLKPDLSIPGKQNSSTSNAFNTTDLNKASLDLGFGAFYQIPGKFYVGLSSTHLPAQSLAGDGKLKFQVSRHYYLMSGYTFQLNKWSKLTPNVLYKSDLASSSLDANLTYLWSDMIWVGGTYRVNDAAAVLVGYQGKAGLGNSIGYKIGYSYDFPASKLKKYTSGTHELLIGVCYTPKIRKVTTYGNDRFLD
jgi:type IX secretion system PorP/SprF family membrane protein